MTSGRALTKMYFSSPRILQKVGLNLYGWWQARQRYGWEFRRILQELEESQFWHHSELQELQNVLLGKLIEHAYHNVPYYRGIFDASCLKPSDIKSREDLYKLPFLTKEIINKHFDKLIARNVPRSKMVLHHTSGTTGQMLKGFYLPKQLRWAIDYAHLYRFYRWAGFDLGEKRATIAGRFFTNRPPYWMINWVERQLLLSAHHLSSYTVDVYIKQIRRFAPRAIQGHPSAITYLGRRLEELDETIPMTAVLTTGEQLYPDHREIIERRFQCKVFDAWGHGEAASMAAECEKHVGYHIASEYGIIEIIERRELGDGVGEIVATSLHNYAMPFIRYKTGDLGSFARDICSCGRGLPLLSRIVGRLDDIIDAPEGEAVLPVSFRTKFAKLDFLKEYQLVQQKANEYRMFILNTGHIGLKEREKILEVLRDYLGALAVIQLELVAEIPRTLGAKQKLIVNRYKPLR